MQLSILNSIKNTIKHWYIPLLIGIVFVIAGFVTFSQPLTALVTLSLLFAVSFLFGGISEVIFSIANRNSMHNWGWSLVFGIVTTILGMLLITNPGLSVEVLILYVGFTILFRSFSSISFAVDLKRYGSKNWGGLLALGILGAIFAFILLLKPNVAGATIVWFVALSFFFSGTFQIILSFQLRRVHRKSKKISKELRTRYQQLEDDFRREWEQNV